MADCCQNLVTPSVIKTGKISVGDHISLEEDTSASLAAAPVTTAVQTPTPAPAPSAMPTPGSASWNNEPPSYSLVFEEMTNYADTIDGSSDGGPSYGIPTHPMVPPGYEQSVDYDSVQYMNGFLRTQIGRALMVQQLIGSGNTADRYGFLVGVGNNYLLLQDISNGNIMMVDFYTVKYVYIYYSQPVFPSFRQADMR